VIRQTKNDRGKRRTAVSFEISWHGTILNKWATKSFILQQRKIWGLRGEAVVAKYMGQIPFLILCGTF
jgi:hypothetical protein